MWVRVARVGKPFGVKGLATVQLFTDAPELRLSSGASLCLDEDGTRPVTLSDVRRMGARWVVGFEGITDRDGAETMRGAELFAPAEAPEDEPTTADEWFDWQLIGLPCRDVTGHELGEVKAVEHPPAHDLLVVRTPSGTLVRVPFVGHIVPEVTAGGVVIDPPGGLFEDESDADADAGADADADADAEGRA